jgi:hypothetical protein
MPTPIAALTPTALRSGSALHFSPIAVQALMEVKALDDDL